MGCIVNFKKKVVTEAKPIKTKVIIYKATADFEIDTSSDAVYYKNDPINYKGNPNYALAINAADKAQRDKFASARLIFKKPSGLYTSALVAMTENDGESTYRIFVNGTEIKTFQNPKTATSFQRVRHDIGDIYLHENDIIEVMSKAVTNGEIPENDETAWSRGRWSQLVLVPAKVSIKNELKDAKPFLEKDGFLQVEAEAYNFKTNNGSTRDWYLRSKSHAVPFSKESIEDHTSSANDNTYIEALPDTRVTHDDALIEGDNFYPIAGVGGIVSYKIRIANPGTYYVWARAFSSGGEDNGLHVGVDEKWPESGARMQWCKGKNKWTWSSAQRVPENHCGVPQTISLDFDKPGDYIISFSMREDGFELDTWIIAKSKDFIPE